MVRALTLKGSVALALLAAASATARADVVVITFDELADRTVVTNQYQGLDVTFAGALILQSPNYNVGGYPPHSGINVIADGNSDGLIQASAAGTSWTSAGAWVTAGSSPITLTAYSSTNVLLGTAIAPVDYGSTEFVSVSAANIAYVKFVATPGYITVDDFTFAPTAVPEPSSVALMGLGGVASLGAWWRRRRGSRRSEGGRIAA